MELADVIFVKRDRVEGGEDRFHHLGIACDLPFVSAGERAETKVREQSFDVAVPSFGAFNTDRRSNAFDRRDSRQPCGNLTRERASVEAGAGVFSSISSVMERGTRRISRNHHHPCWITIGLYDSKGT